LPAVPWNEGLAVGFGTLTSFLNFMQVRIDVLDLPGWADALKVGEFTNCIIIVVGEVERAGEIPTGVFVIGLLLEPAEGKRFQLAELVFIE